MDRQTEEADYVLQNLLRMRDEIAGHPDWFEPDALERLERAIVTIREIRLMPKAA